MNRVLFLSTILVFLMVFGCDQSNQIAPTFSEGQDPSSADQTWKLVPSLSDEFNDPDLDTSKWYNTVPGGWIGRPPGLFKANTVSMADGKLLVTTDQLPEPEIIDEKEFTHAGAHIQSKLTANVGLYFECSMKANKTFMSSTFWLINDWKSFEGCDNRVTELDIQEAVGYINTEKEFAQTFNEKMNSNTHSRLVTCEDSVGIVGNKAKMEGKVYDDFHVFGAWWKSPREILFFLDGNHVGTVEPVADFDLPMHIKLVIETYNWNPTPEDGGMNMSAEDRTTYYDWVRVWELE
ncbi:MAG: glycoside hydrolase [Bacteroidota bacterium]